MALRYDIVVVGHGAAGLTAALAAAELCRDHAMPLSIAVLERTPNGEHGGNTRFTPCYMRMDETDRISPDFVDDMLAVSDGRNDRAYFTHLAEEAPATMAWLQAHGVAFHKPVYYLAAGPQRIQPVGGGETLVRELTRAASAAGVDFLYDCDARELATDASGAVTGIHVEHAGAGQTIAARAVGLASGGFQGNAAMLKDHLGSAGETLVPISPGTRRNTGSGIRMALAAGAAAAGDWQGMHIEPIDPRASAPAPVVLVYPYGIVVNRNAERFFDEGAGLVHETWETFARTIHFDQPGSIAYAILDGKLHDIEDYQRALRTDVAPVEAPTLADLARLIGMPPAVLTETVAAYNAACTGDAARFDATTLDGLATAPGLAPSKSNWARPLDRPPYIAWPLIGAIVYTFGGLATDTGGRVLDDAARPLAGLYAAGEITGHFHGTAPNAVSVLRAVVYGRRAGRAMVRDLAGASAS